MTVVQSRSGVTGTRSRQPDGPASTRQPALGLKGLVLVVPVSAALAVGAGGEGSVHVLGPIITFSLPLVVMVAFWWADWPGTRFRGGREAGWIDTLLIAAAALVLTGMAQILAGHLDLAGLFEPSVGPGHVPIFPATLPLGGTAFVAMLQLTLVGEGWPLHRLAPVPGGLLAVAASWAVGVVVYLTVVEVDPPSGSEVIARTGPVTGATLGAVLVLISAWQVLAYVCWRGWPFAAIARRSVRLPCGHVVVLACGIISFVVAHRVLGFGPARIAAVAGCFVAAGLVLGMLLEDWLAPLGAQSERVTVLAGALALAAALAVVLTAAARALQLSGTTVDDWVGHAALNGVSTAILLHVAIYRRWPFGGPVQGRVRSRSAFLRRTRAH